MSANLKTILLRSAIAIFCGLLMYCAFDLYAGVFLAILSFVLLADIIDRTGKVWERSLSISLFFFVLVFLQLEFVIEKAYDIGIELILYNILTFLVLTLPVLLFVCVRTVFRVEMMFCGIFISEFLFTSLNVGNQTFQYGILLSDFPWAIQWYEYTGVYAGTIWIMAISLLLYKNIRKKSSIVCLLLTILFPLCISFCIKDKENDTKLNVEVLSIADESDADQIVCILEKTNLENVDMVIIPEGIITCNENTMLYNPLLTSLKRISNKNGLDIIVGVFARQASGKISNSVLVFSEGQTYRRYKTLMMPFSEYLPWSEVLSKINFIQKNIFYLLENKENNTEFYLHQGHPISPIICYEALSTSFLSKIVADKVEMFVVSSSNSFVNSRHIETICERLLRINAITTKKCFARSTEHGYSSLVDANGRMLKCSKYFTGLIEARLSLHQDITYYVGHEKLIKWLYFLLFFVILFLLSRARGCKKVKKVL